MMKRLTQGPRCVLSLLLLAQLLLFGLPGNAEANEVALGGFIPFVGIGMTNEFKTLDSIDLGGIPFIADPAFEVGDTLLGSTGPMQGDGSRPFFDVALLDTGAATHIITQEAFDGFEIVANGMRGTNVQPIGGATGVINTEINDAAGLYTAGLGDRNATGTHLGMNPAALRGQTSIATLTAPDEWSLPNILGLPMAAQHAIAIRNDDPLIFQHQGRTVRTPQVDFIDIGTGVDEGILRRAPLRLNPGIGFVQGPQFVFNLDVGDIFGGGGEILVHNNPASPSVILDSNGNGGGMFLEVDLERGGEGFQDRELLFDTGADLTVISELMAKRLGFDAVLDTPDFVLEVEGSGGVQGGVPGFFIDELNIDTVGGDFRLQNVPVAVLDVANPNDPGNIIDGIIGMHLFNGRNLVIDANPATGAGGVGPSLFISDPVTNVRTWNEAGGNSNWESDANWQEGPAPNNLSDVLVIADAAGASEQQALLNSDATIFRMTVQGDGGKSIRLNIGDNDTLTVFGETRIEEGGRIHIDNGKVDAQFINLNGGTLSGEGDVFVGTGSISSAVRNLGGTVDPGPDASATGTLSIEGDFANLAAGTLKIDIANLSDVVSNDLLDASRFAFLAGTLEVTYSEQSSDPLEIGTMFTILTAGTVVEGELEGGVEGQFDNLILPGEFTWDISYLADSVVLEVTGAGLVGDFNGDGKVDSLDYATWREGLGGAYTTAHYEMWRTGFGAANNPGQASGGVPEPATLLLALVASSLALPTRRR